jgi:hypothetical protein
MSIFSMGLRHSHARGEEIETFSFCYDEFVVINVPVSEYAD